MSSTSGMSPRVCGSGASVAAAVWTGAVGLVPAVCFSLRPQPHRSAESMQTASKHVICRFMQKTPQFDCKHSLPYLEMYYQLFSPTAARGLPMRGGSGIMV